MYKFLYMRTMKNTQEFYFIGIKWVVNTSKNVHLRVPQPAEVPKLNEVWASEE